VIAGEQSSVTGTACANDEAPTRRVEHARKMALQMPIIIYMYHLYDLNDVRKDRWRLTNVVHGQNQVRSSSIQSSE
jgi:hypothetical protein